MKKDDHAAIGIITIGGFKLLIVEQKDAQTHRSITYKNSFFKNFFFSFFIVFKKKKYLMMKHVLRTIRDKYEILGIIGEGRFFKSFFVLSLFYIFKTKGAYGVVLKDQKKVCFRNEKEKKKKRFSFSI